MRRKKEISITSHELGEILWLFIIIRCATDVVALLLFVGRRGTMGPVFVVEMIRIGDGWYGGGETIRFVTVADDVDIGCCLTGDDGARVYED